MVTQHHRRFQKKVGTMMNDEQLAFMNMSQLRALPNGNVLLPLTPPPTVAQTHRLIEQICSFTGATQKHIHWGADRCQANLYLNDCEFEIQIDWLCESIWITPPTGSSAMEFMETLTAYQTGKINKISAG